MGEILILVGGGREAEVKRNENEKREQQNFFHALLGETNITIISTQGYQVTPSGSHSTR